MQPWTKTKAQAIAQAKQSDPFDVVFVCYSKARKGWEVMNWRATDVSIRYIGGRAA